MKNLMDDVVRKLKIRQGWGLWLLLFAVLGTVIFWMIWGDKVYFPVNDNFDYNIAHAKMFRDNRLWQDRQTQVPFLGGVDRSIFIYDYNLTSMIYYVFDTQTAYWICHVIAVIFSGGGVFY